MRGNMKFLTMAASLLVLMNINTKAFGSIYPDYAVDTITGSNKYSYHVTAIYSDGTEEDATDSAIVGYSPEGLCIADSGVITGKKYGNVTLTFQLGEEKDSLPLIVEDIAAERTVASIAYTPETMSISLGKKATFTANAVFKDGHSLDITKLVKFYSSNSGIIKVNGDSVISVASGTANVKASYKGTMGNAVIGLLPVTVNYQNPYQKNEAEDYTSQSGIQCETLSSTDKNVAYIENTDWVQYNGMDFGSTGAGKFTVYAATANSGGSIKIYAGGTLVGTCAITNTGSWTTWKPFSCNVDNITGVKNIRLLFSGASGYLYNINSWFFTKTTTGINAISMDTEKVDVYTIDGVRIKRDAHSENWKQGLKSGVYIVGDKKVEIR